jgi:hypothetical protein
LRKKQIELDPNKANAKIELYNLLCDALDTETSNFQKLVSSVPLKANSLQEFVERLDCVLNLAGADVVQQASCVYLIRNFTGHHFEISNQVMSSTLKTLFNMYEPALEKVILFIFHLCHIKAI